MRTNQEDEERRLAYCQAIAGKLRANPSLLAIATSNLDRWGFTTPAFSLWRRLLDGNDLEAILKVLLDPGEYGEDMRKSTPFTGILTPGERMVIFRRHQRRSCRHGWTAERDKRREALARGDANGAQEARKSMRRAAAARAGRALLS
jgi:hypothetical protein